MLRLIMRDPIGDLRIAFGKGPRDVEGGPVFAGAESCDWIVPARLGTPGVAGPNDAGPVVVQDPSELAAWEIGDSRSGVGHKLKSFGERHAAVITQLTRRLDLKG